MFLLDSDVCIELLRGRLPLVRDLMRASDPRLFGVPAVVEAELRAGARKSDRPRENLLLLERFLDPLARVPFDSDCAVAYARIRAQLERAGRPIGPNDLLIAATAVARQATLVTNNVREFKRVEGLDLEVWGEEDLAAET